MPYDDGLANLRTLWAGFHPRGRVFHPVTTQPKGVNRWLKSLQPNELPLVLRARPAAAGAARHSRAAKSNPSPRCTEAKNPMRIKEAQTFILHAPVTHNLIGDSTHFDLFDKVELLDVVKWKVVKDWKD